MRVGYRHCDSRFPFLWQTSAQPPARWHGPGEGPAHYFADTPVGAWAEFLRHEGIVDAADLAGVQRSLWVVELPAAGDWEIAVDSAGRVHVAWNGVVGVGGRYHQWSDDGGLAWSAVADVVAAGQGGTEGPPQLAIDSADTLHLLSLIHISEPTSPY